MKNLIFSNTYIEILRQFIFAFKIQLKKINIIYDIISINIYLYFILWSYNMYNKLINNLNNIINLYMVILMKKSIFFFIKNWIKINIKKKLYIKWYLIYLIYLILNNK